MSFDSDGGDSLLTATALAAWPSLVIDRPITEGARSSVWRGSINGESVAVRRSNRSEESLDWELALMQDLDAAGFLVPTPIATSSGSWRSGRWTAQAWISGRQPTSVEDWRAVADELPRLHRSQVSRAQRPGACSITELATIRRSVDADLDRTPPWVVEQCLTHFRAYVGGQRSVVHGDPGPGNIRVTTDGRIGLIDWDESRTDVPDLDLANLGTTVLRGARKRAAEEAAHAWEALNAWNAEPDYARRRLRALT